MAFRRDAVARRWAFSLPAAAAMTLIVTGGLRADDVKTAVCKVPYPIAPEPQRPKRISLDSAFRHWSTKIVWEKSHGVENYAEVRLITADVIAGLTNRLAQDRKLTDAEAQTLYDEHCKRYYGVADTGIFGEKIAFMGHFELDAESFTAGQANTLYEFSLIAEGGKPLSPAKVELGDVVRRKGDAGASVWYRPFTVTFDNQAPQTKRRAVIAGVHALTLVVKGAPGEGRATYLFDSAAR